MNPFQMATSSLFSELCRDTPRLWEKHIDKILRKIDVTPTTHEPCVYSGITEGERGAASSERICKIVFDLIDDELDLPLKLKSLGLINLFNGVNALETRHYDYVKLLVD